MTTSVLNTFTSGPLNDFDLQVLRDYALEAPEPWRHAFDRLIAAAEEQFREEELLAEIAELKEKMKTARGEVLSLVLACQAELAKNAPSLTELVEKVSDQLESLADDLEPPVKAEKKMEVKPGEKT